MGITDAVEALRQNTKIIEKLSAVQDLGVLQREYHRQLAQGLVTKREYNLAPVNVLGVSIPGQTTFKINI